MASPAAQAQIHQRSEAGISFLAMSSTSRATAQPAVMTAVMSWSLPSKGGGAGRSGLLTAIRLVQRGGHLQAPSAAVAAAAGSGRGVLGAPQPGPPPVRFADRLTECSAAAYG